MSNVSVAEKDVLAAGRTPDQKKSDSVWKWTAMGVGLIAGTAMLMAIKTMTRHLVAVGSGELKQYDQPFCQTFVMFLGEGMCLLVVFYEDHVTKKTGRAHGVFEFATAEDLAKPRTPWWYWVLPACLDGIGTTLTNAALTMTYGSTVQILRTTMLVLTSLFALCLMRKPLRIHEWLGIFVMTGGMISAGIMAVLHPEVAESIDPTKSKIGVVLTLIGTIFSAIQLAVEEKFFDKTYCPPLMGVGVEGCTGAFLSIFAIIICHYAKFYNFRDGIDQLKNSPRIIGCYVGVFFTVFIFNGAGLLTTFLGGGILRGVLYTCRSPVLYLVELAARMQTFTVGGIVSVILTSLGFLIYAYILPGINRRNTPSTHHILRKGVPCFCTYELEETDNEGDEGAEALMGGPSEEI